MHTPIADFLDSYTASGTARLHMPGHKGVSVTGAEPWDLTEITGADSLYAAEGIIHESEMNAAGLFGSAASFYSCEGSSLCIRAMLRLLLQCKAPDAAPLIIAARNVHKTFVSAAALLGFDVRWLPRSADSRSVCSLSADPDVLETTLSEVRPKPAAVYITSPDYLGGMADIPTLSSVCHRHGVPLAVDNAHGAYLRFLPKSLHPLQLGATVCCDSAHKTLPVLTGGAYLHIAPCAPESMREQAKAALALFGSTSPSYLILRSLDLCNRILSDDFPDRLTETVFRLDSLRARLCKAGVPIMDSDPLKITIEAPVGTSGYAMAAALREAGAECEFADNDYLVLMFTPYNPPRDFDITENTLRRFVGPRRKACAPLPSALPEQVTDIRTALLGATCPVSTADAAGCICAGLPVSCPPAIPIVMPGERIDGETAELLRYYGTEQLTVLR